MPSSTMHVDFVIRKIPTLECLTPHQCSTFWSFNKCNKEISTDNHEISKKRMNAKGKQLN